MTLPLQQYVFKTIVTRVIDGDTIDCDIDLGLHCHRIERVRLLRVNAPELFGVDKEKGLASKQFVIDWLANQQTLVQTYKSDVFGRYLAEVWRMSDGANLSDDLLATNNAVPYP
jgi:endonuclease YncB( thermonuclease family)